MNGYKEAKEKVLNYIEDMNPTLSEEKKLKVFDMAWDHGHSGGMNDIMFWVDEFLELLK